MTDAAINSDSAAPVDQPRHDDEWRPWISKRARLLFPLITWLPQYGDHLRENLYGDFMAGLTVSMMLVPQCISYSLLAGCPPIYGIYSGLVPALILPFFTTTSTINIGPTAATSLMVPVALAGIAKVQSPEYVLLSFYFAFMSGVILVLMAALKIGTLVENCLSKPVLTGYMNATALIIILSQVKFVFGVKMDSINTLVDAGNQFSQSLGNTNGWSVLIFVCCTFIIMLPKYVKAIERAPGGIIALVLSTVIVFLTGADKSVKVPVVGYIPPGMPHLSDFSQLNWSFLVQQAIPALSLSLIGYLGMVGYMESVAASAKPDDSNKIRMRSNQEMLGLGVCNLVGSFFQNFPVTGALSRSAVQKQAGAKTPATSWFVAGILIIVLLVATELFYYTPQACLGAVVISGAVSLFDFQNPKFYWHYSKTEFWIFVFMTLVTLFLGVGTAVILGIGSSILQLIQQASHPRMARVGRLDEVHSDVSSHVTAEQEIKMFNASQRVDYDDSRFRDVVRFPSAITVDGILAVRLDAPGLTFYNMPWISRRLDAMERELAAKGNRIRYIVLCCAASTHIDSTAVSALKIMFAKYQSRNVRLLFSNIRPPMRDAIRHAGLVEQFGQLHSTIYSAVDEAEKLLVVEHQAIEHSNNPQDVSIEMPSVAILQRKPSEMALSPNPLARANSIKTAVIHSVGESDEHRSGVELAMQEHVLDADLADIRDIERDQL